MSANLSKKSPQITPTYDTLLVFITHVPMSAHAAETDGLLGDINAAFLVLGTARLVGAGFLQVTLMLQL